MADDGPVPTLDADPDEEPTTRERLARLLERRLDIPMAILAIAWASRALPNRNLSPPAPPSVR